VLFTEYDIVFLHPPSIVDFWKRPWFPGPIATTVANLTPAFIMLPIGVVSSADYLDRQGYHVRVINIAEKTVEDSKFNAADYISKLEASVFGVDLHWCVHSRGAIDIAALCKQSHPNSKVILGGLTATKFDQEIVSKYPWVDAVVRGEAEESIADYVHKLHAGGSFSDVSNLTYRESDGTLRRNNLRKPTIDLDGLCFSRLDLVESHTRLTSVHSRNRTLKVWNLPICRGCVFNCATCGGSAYSYRTLFGRDRPAFISPKKMIEEFQELDAQKFNSIFLFQDMRMGGDKYWKTLLQCLHKERWSHLEHVTLELFEEADETFFRTLRKFKPTERVGITISAESGSETVRRAQGRSYSNDSLLKVIRSSLDNGFPISTYFMLALAREDSASIDDTYKLWEKILQLNHHDTNAKALLDFGPMILLDPGSLAFDRSHANGYSLRCRSFQDYYERLGLPSWKQWISYETDSLSAENIVNLVLDSTSRFADLFESFQLMSRDQSQKLKQSVSLERIVLKEIDSIMHISDGEEKANRLNELREIVRDPLLSYSYLLTHDT